MTDDDVGAICGLEHDFVAHRGPDPGLRPTAESAPWVDTAVAFSLGSTTELALVAMRGRDDELAAGRLDSQGRADTIAMDAIA